MSVPLSVQAKKIIDKILYITLATTSKQGQPWNSPVYSAFDENYNFYWISWKENQHSQNIRENNRIFIVIYDSTVSEGQGQGVYIQAKAYELNDEKNINNALKYLDGRIGKQDRHKASQFQGNMPRRIYKAVPEKAWVNVDSRINGEFVDKRVEIKL